MDGFQWDDENILRMARHEVTQGEVEEVICGPVLELEVQYENGEERFLCRACQGFASSNSEGCSGRDTCH